jgi:ABC-2 type transport system ATP-binding protein
VKRFGDVVAVDGLDIRVPRGVVYGVLGPNGAGKTTAIRMLATLVTPDAGQARILGRDAVADAAQVRRRIGLTGQFASVDDDLTGRQNLVLVAKLLGRRRAAAHRRAADLLAAFGLSGAADRLVKTYSGGMRRRLDLAASLVIRPDVLFLDEPSAGLDPRSRMQVWEVVRALVKRGTTVVLTTQYLEEADALADRIAVIDRGRVVAEGPPADLKASIGAGAVRLRVADPAQRDAAVGLLAAATGADVVGGVDPLSLSVRTETDQQAVRALSALVEGGVALSDFSVGRPNLDEVFLSLTGHDTTQGELPYERRQRRFGHDAVRAARRGAR